METITSNTRADSVALRQARAALAEAGMAADARLHAEGVAGTLLALGAEESIVLGSLAAPLLWAGQTDEAVAAQMGAEPVRLARGLERLGNLGAGWNPASRLSAAQAETLRKMLIALAADPRLILLRLAERLQALREAKSRPPAEQQRLALEAREIDAPLANRLGVWELKWQLEDLAFRYLDAENYRRIAAALNARRVERERYVAEVCQELRTALEHTGIAAEVSGRAKHIHSIWRKMQRKRLPFAQVFDVRALRVLVGSVTECYAALGVVHGLWPYIEQEFDDYIATPKDNLYRSIHTAVYGPGHLPLEVQIRTRQMHEQAELGVAAHWKYKEGGARDAAYEAKIQWVRQLLAPAGAAAEGDFFDRVRAELFEDRICALTPRGEVIDLPKGATPLDFAYHVHTELGHRCRGAKVNGRIVPLTHRLQNGEVVEILTRKVAQPNRDWLNAALGFLASARSRAKMRAYFRRQDRPAAEPTPEPPLVPARVIAPPRRTRLTPAEDARVLIEGLGDLTSHLARCCRPVPPEAIAGYITAARGVSIHCSDCASFLRMKARYPQRELAVEWSPGAAPMGRLLAHRTPQDR